MKWKILSSILLVGTLVACSQPTAIEQPKEEKKVEHKVEVQKPKPQVMTDEEAMMAYSNELRPLLTDLSTDIGFINKLSLIGANDPSSMLTSDYIETTQMICDDMKGIVAKVRAINTHGNKKVTTIQEKVLEAVNKFEFVADNFPIAVRTMNADLIGDCADAMTRSGQLFVQVTELIQEEGVN